MPLLLLLPLLLQQNLALAVVSVVFATVPTVAGFFPLWLAVTLHEGSTLLVALNSLRLLLETGGGGGGSGAAGGSKQQQQQAGGQQQRQQKNDPAPALKLAAAAAEQSSSL